MYFLRNFSKHPYKLDSLAYLDISQKISTHLIVFHAKN